MLTCDPVSIPLLGFKASNDLGLIQLSAEGVRPDQEKIKAITEMPAPIDKKGVQRLLGTVNYLAKFVPNMSAVTDPIRKRKEENGWNRSNPNKTVSNSLSIFAYRVSASVNDLDAKAIGFPSCSKTAPKPEFDASQLTVMGFDTSKNLKTGSFKFVPNMSAVTDPIRKRKEENEFVCTHEQNAAFEKIKNILTNDPVLRFFDVSKPITVSCDASNSGFLGGKFPRDFLTIASSGL
jgi:hypothetical protein